jgi:hypothetical protein
MTRDRLRHLLHTCVRLHTDQLRAQKKAEFLALARVMPVDAAAKGAGIAKETVYYWRALDTRFAKAMDASTRAARSREVIGNGWVPPAKRRGNSAWGRAMCLKSLGARGQRARRQKLIERGIPVREYFIKQAAKMRAAKVAKRQARQQAEEHTDGSAISHP